MANLSGTVMNGKKLIVYSTLFGFFSSSTHFYPFVNSSC
jgi:hypothetical protein